MADTLPHASLNGTATARVMFAGRSSSLSSQIVADVRDALFAKRLAGLRNHLVAEFSDNGGHIKAHVQSPRVAKRADASSRACEYGVAMQ